jgi:hypothetical protein
MTDSFIVEGMLYLTNQRLVFRSYGGEAVQGMFSTLLAELTGCSCHSRLLGLKSYLVITTRTGQERFWVGDPYKWKIAILGEVARKGEEKEKKKEEKEMRLFSGH